MTQNAPLANLQITLIYGEWLNITNGRDSIQWDLDKPESEANRNLMKLSEEKCRVFHLGQNNAIWTGKCLSTSPAGKDVGVLEDASLNVSQQCFLTVRKANPIGGCIRNSVSNRLKEVTFSPVLGAGAVTPGIQYCILGSAVQEGYGKTGEGPVKGYQNGE